MNADTNEMNGSVTNSSNPNRGLLGSIGGAVVGGALDMLSSNIDYNRQKNMIKRQNQREDAVYARQRADFEADRAHDELYNSPQNQMAMARRAGLNPFTYDTQANNTQSTADSPSMSPNGYDPMSVGSVGLGSAVGRGIDTAFQLKQMEYYDSLIKKTNEDTEGIKLDNVFKGATIDPRIQQEFTKNDVGVATLDNLLAENNQIQASTKLTQEQRRGLKLENDYFMAVKNFRIQLEGLEVSKKVADINYTDQLTKSLQEQIKQGWTHLTIEKMNAETNELNAWTNRGEYQLDMQKRVDNLRKLEQDLKIGEVNYELLETELGVKKETFDDMVNQIKSNAHISEVEAKYAAFKQVYDMALSGIDTMGRFYSNRQMGKYMRDKRGSMRYNDVLNGVKTFAPFTNWNTPQVSNVPLMGNW